MADQKREKATPVTEDEIDKRDYIALIPLDKNGKDNADGDVYLYRYSEDADGIPSVAFIEDPDEYEAAADRFDEMLDEELFDQMDK